MQGGEDSINAGPCRLHPCRLPQSRNVVGDGVCRRRPRSNVRAKKITVRLSAFSTWISQHDLRLLQPLHIVCGRLALQDLQTTTGNGHAAAWIVARGGKYDSAEPRRKPHSLWIKPFNSSSALAAADSWGARRDSSVSTVRVTLMATAIQSGWAMMIELLDDESSDETDCNDNGSTKTN